MINSTIQILIFLFLVFVSCSGNDLEDISQPVDSPKWTFAVLGNSISTYQGTMPNGYPYYYSQALMNKEDMWWSILEINTNSIMLANSSWSGATVSFRHNVDTCSFFYSDTRILSLSRNGIPDAIIVLGGTNDWNRNVLLGSQKDEGNVNTLFGAYLLMVRKLINKYPQSKIFLCSILPRKQGHDIKNSSGWTIREGNELIRTIANKLNVYFLDLDECGLATDIASYTFDGLHPNKTGMRLIADNMTIEVATIMNNE